MENKQPVPETLSLESFTANGEAALRRVLESGAPLEITLEGRPVLIVMTAADYEPRQSQIESVRESVLIAERLARADVDSTVPLDHAVAELRQQYGL
jgi:PHD/YefM family antitoxin component YafN of YafNO toxin-antitoxin module